MRQYDRNGYGAGPDVQYLAVEAAPAAQAIRREIVRQEKHQKTPSFKRVLTAVGIDPANGEVWMAVGQHAAAFRQRRKPPRQLSALHAGRRAAGSEYHLDRTRTA